MITDTTEVPGETEKTPITQIERIIERCGIDRVQAWLRSWYDEIIGEGAV